MTQNLPPVIALGRAFNVPAEKVLEYATNMMAAGATKVMIAVDAERDGTGLLKQSWPQYMDVFPVQPWGIWYAAIPILALRARDFVRDNNADLLYSSADVRLTPEGLNQLRIAVHQPNVMAAGPVFPEHNYVPGLLLEDAGGDQIPYHKCVLIRGEVAWKLPYFITGDGLPSDPRGEDKGIIKYVNAGVEEYVPWLAFQFLQKVLFGTEWELVLMPIEGINLDTLAQTDAQRAEMKNKWATKAVRPNAQRLFHGFPQALRVRQK